MIQDKTLFDTDPEVLLIPTGFNKGGYNYGAHLFNGKYCDVYYNVAWCQEYKDIDLVMKWNDAWKSNKDCDGDGLLDRHYGYDTYIGSGAWLTNHQKGVYDDQDGKKCDWVYFSKIVAVPSDAVKADNLWYAADGILMGPVIWEQFAIIQEQQNDPCGEFGGKLRGKYPLPGLGNW